MSAALAAPFTDPEAEADQARLGELLRAHAPERPTLLIDRAIVARRYRALAAALAPARLHYAVKANPARAVIETLAAEGAAFDAASRAEIELCLSLGVRAGDISFGNTVKRAGDIAFAHQAGVRLFVADAEEEIEKIACHAPGAELTIRVAVAAGSADWPLARKFGARPEAVAELLDLARARGLAPVGLSFHVGSQTRHAGDWAGPLDVVAGVWKAARAAGHGMEVLNIGGGFPARYDPAIAPAPAYGRQVMALLADRMGRVPRLIAEPGRAIVAEAGMIAAEVLLVARRSRLDAHRWVYLDIGRFSGLAETEDEAIRYPVLTDRDHESTGPCILAGPTCDSVDVMYEKRPLPLPMGLQAGDRVYIAAAGAYTASYASVGFNGFAPPELIVV